MNTKFAYQEKIAASMSNLSEEYLAMVKLENKLGKNHFASYLPQHVA
jgi:hypothetical protein